MKVARNLISNPQAHAKSPARSSELSYLWLTGPIIFYLALSFYQLDLPGLHYDEAFEAVPALQLLLGQPVTAFRSSGFNLAGQTYPFMTQDYIGALNTYLALPFVAVFGSTPAALRTFSILVGLVTLLLSCRLTAFLTARRWTGLVAALLLSVEPTFIFWNRQGIFVTAITAAIGLAAAHCWLARLFSNRSHQTPVITPPRPSGAAGRAIAGAFLLGLGLYAKLLFIWFIAALVGALILLNLPSLTKYIKHPARLLPALRQFSPAEVGLAGLAFLLGCAPLLAYNLQTSGTFLSITQNAAISYYGVDNFAFAANLLSRLSQLVVLLNGGHFWYMGNIVTNWWSPVFFALIFLGIMVPITTRSIRSLPTPATCAPLSPARAALLPFLIIGLVTLASIVTVSALWITHFAILMPWPAIAIAAGSWFILRHPAAGAPAGQQKLRPPARQIIVVAGLALLVTTNLAVTLQYHAQLSRSGGLGSHSDAIYDLSHWLDQHAAGRPVVAMDWGLAAPVTYLTHGRVSPTEIFGYTWQSDHHLAGWLDDYIAQPDTLYLWRGPGEVIFDRSADFKALYRPQQLEETIEAAFYENSGRPILGVTRLVPCGAPNIVPPEPSPYCQ